MTETHSKSNSFEHSRNATYLNDLEMKSSNFFHISEFYSQDNSHDYTIKRWRSLWNIADSKKKAKRDDQLTYLKTLHFKFRSSFKFRLKFTHQSNSSNPYRLVRQHFFLAIQQTVLQCHLLGPSSPWRWTSDSSALTAKGNSDRRPKKKSRLVQTSTTYLQYTMSRVKNAGW